MEGMLEPEEVEESVGTVEVRQTFRASRIGTIAGSYVTDGMSAAGRRCASVRDGTVVYDARSAPAALQRGRARGAPGFECGIVLRNFQDVKEGDVLEVYETQAGRARAVLSAG